MKNILLIIIFMVFSLIGFNQTVIEMKYIEDADIVLREVTNIDSADIVIYKTDCKSCAVTWDCMWMFKNWGFSNFSIYLIKDSVEISTTDTSGTIKPISGNVFFTDDYKLRGYKNTKFHLNGIMKVNRKRKKPHFNQ